VTAEELRRRIKNRIDTLSPERLVIAEDFLAYLQERESDEATAELLRIPGLVNELERAEDEANAGRLTPTKQLRRKRSA
jgi:hypothetical protein